MQYCTTSLFRSPKFHFFFIIIIIIIIIIMNEFLDYYNIYNM